jgi:hypothetical protein
MNATETSKTMSTIPDSTMIGAVTNDNLPPFTSLINRCPATMLAARRTDSVIGRIKFLTSSITTIKGIRTSGVPDGTKCAKNLFIALKINPNSIKTHTQIAIPRVNEILLEGVKV